jgi:hypothetical protein
LHRSAAAVVLGALFFAASSGADLYDSSIVQHEDTRSQLALERYQAFFGTPFLGIRAALVVPSAALGEFGNGVLWLMDRSAPGTFPHAEPGWLWNGALRSLREDWNESTPGP